MFLNSLLGRDDSRFNTSCNAGKRGLTRADDSFFSWGATLGWFWGRPILTIYSPIVFSYFDYFGPVEFIHYNKWVAVEMSDKVADECKYIWLLNFIWYVTFDLILWSNYQSFSISLLVSSKNFLFSYFLSYAFIFITLIQRITIDYNIVIVKK